MRVGESEFLFRGGRERAGDGSEGEREREGGDSVPGCVRVCVCLCGGACPRCVGFFGGLFVMVCCACLGYLLETWENDLGWWGLAASVARRWSRSSNFTHALVGGKDLWLFF